MHVTHVLNAREERSEPRHPSSIVGMISFWVIILVPQHSEHHLQVINPRLFAISSCGSQETCRIHVVMWESWRGPEWSHLLVCQTPEARTTPSLFTCTVKVKHWPISTKTWSFDSSSSSQPRNCTFVPSRFLSLGAAVGLSTYVCLLRPTNYLFKANYINQWDDLTYPEC